jgi:pimeloyl-ACP methyl ester carboxylesterase
LPTRLERNTAVNIALWILQGLLALSMLASGGMKFAKSKATLVSDFKMAWATDFSETQIKLIASAEVVGAIGLIVPRATLIAPVLTPVVAVCLAILLLGAARIHFGRKESFAPPLVIAVLCLIVAVGRSGLRSLPSDDFRRATALRAAQPFASGIERLPHSIEATAEMTVPTIAPPALRMADNMPNLRVTLILPGVGHWAQQEAPEAVNAALLSFLTGVSIDRKGGSAPSAPAPQVTPCGG